MSNRKSPFYSAMAILFGLIVLAGGAAKFYRGLSALNSSSTNPKVRELLTASDAAVLDANREIQLAGPQFQTLLEDFDSMGPVSFRKERHQAAELLSQRYRTVIQQLRLASSKALEATQLDTDGKANGFLTAKSQSYEHLATANEKNAEIVQALMDTSISEVDAIIAKVQELATLRAADQKASDEADALASTFIEK